ncbi:hypothetical protein B0H17DRAFT_1302556 [Mycena rosella]|uniref:Uncharacterized protein n=1 Tax=Mycena rosella TaxID=1033263 RepID=A0AAD7GBN3_MYCRO|nr:hypothetical protein B0H17DRAFT_1302556 [Mycena rosella]
MCRPESALEHNTIVCQFRHLVLCGMDEQDLRGSSFALTQFVYLRLVSSPPSKQRASKSAGEETKALTRVPQLGAPNLRYSIRSASAPSQRSAGRAEADVRRRIEEVGGRVRESHQRQVRGVAEQWQRRDMRRWAEGASTHAGGSRKVQGHRPSRRGVEKRRWGRESMGDVAGKAEAPERDSSPAIILRRVKSAQRGRSRRKRKKGVTRSTQRVGRAGCRKHAAHKGTASRCASPSYHSVVQVRVKSAKRHRHYDGQEEGRDAVAAAVVARRARTSNRKHARCRSGGVPAVPASEPDSSTVGEHHTGVEFSHREEEEWTLWREGHDEQQVVGMGRAQPAFDRVWTNYTERRPFGAGRKGENGDKGTGRPRGIQWGSSGWARAINAGATREDSTTASAGEVIRPVPSATCAGALAGEHRRASPYALPKSTGTGKEDSERRGERGHEPRLSVLPGRAEKKRDTTVVDDLGRGGGGDVVPKAWRQGRASERATARNLTVHVALPPLARRIGAGLTRRKDGGQWCAEKRRGCCREHAEPQPGEEHHEARPGLLALGDVLHLIGEE